MAASQFYRQLHTVNQIAAQHECTDLVELCQRKKFSLRVLMRKLLNLPPSVEITAVFSKACGGSLELDSNFASGAMSTLMRLKDENTDFVAKALSPVSAPADPMTFSGIPTEQPGFSLRSCAYYKTACFFGQEGLVPKTCVVLVDGIPCLAQDFVSGEEVLLSKKIPFQDMDISRLVQEIEKGDIDLGQHYEAKQDAKVYLNTFTKAHASSNTVRAAMLLDGELKNRIHVQISPMCMKEFIEHLEDYNVEKVAEMFEQGKIHLKTQGAFHAGLARSENLCRIHKIASANVTIDYSTPHMQKRMANLHCLDLLTGQIDRHVGNIRYRPVINDVGQTTDYEPVSIDNDLSFGKKFISIAPEELFSMSVQGPKYRPTLFDKELAEILCSRTWPEWETELRFCALGTEEIEAAKRRYRHLYTAINNAYRRSLKESDGSHPYMEGSAGEKTTYSEVVSQWNDLTYRKQLSHTPVNSYLAHHALARVLAAQSSPEFIALLNTSLEGNGALIRDCLYAKGGIYYLGPDTKKLLTKDAAKTDPVIMHEALHYPEYSKVLELYAKHADDAAFTQLMTADYQGQKKILTTAIQMPSPDIPDKLYARLVTCTPGLLEKLLSEGVQMNNNLAVAILDQLASKKQKTPGEQALINRAHLAINKHFEWFGDYQEYSQPK